MNQDEIHDLIVRQLSQWVENLPSPDTPLVGISGSKGVLTPRQIVKEVKDRTTFGQKLVERWCKMAVSHVLNIDPLLRPAEGGDADKA